MTKRLATKLTWKKCQCGDKVCDRNYPEELGNFYQGTGFTTPEMHHINRAFKALRNSFRTSHTKLERQLYRALKEAKDHLNYCNHGADDRGAKHSLQKQIDKAMAEYQKEN